MSAAETMAARSLHAKSACAVPALASSRSDIGELSHRVLLAQEAERMRIALELHDGVGQSLTVIKYLVEDFISAQASTGDSTRGEAVDTSELERVVRRIQGAIEEVRRTALNLRPVMLDDLGLLCAIEWLHRETANICPDLVIESDISMSEDEVPEPLKLVIFRLIQEGLNNVTKHARASHAYITLERQEACLRLAIVDNGRGFQLPERMDTSPGLGLVNMQQRVALSGGKISIAPNPGEGTAVTVVWPL